MLIATPSTLPRGSSGSADAHPGCIIYASVGPTSARSVSTELHSDFSKMSPWKLLHTKMVALRRGRNGTSLNTSIRTAVLSVYGGGSWGWGGQKYAREEACRARPCRAGRARPRARSGSCRSCCAASRSRGSRTMALRVVDWRRGREAGKAGLMRTGRHTRDGT